MCGWSFIDTNDGRLETHKYEHLPMPLAEVRQLLKLYAIDPVGKTLPAAYVIATWAPEEHHLDEAGLPVGSLLLGFGIEDLAPGYRTLLEQVQIRRRHQPVFDLLHSMNKHHVIPATFDGEAAAFAKGAPPNSLKVGQWYDVGGPDGQRIKGVLESGTVVIEQKSAWCVFRGGDGSRSISTVPLTDVELEAFKQHPATFFGTIDRNAGRPPMKTAMDWFEFLWESYKATPKERLLEFMAAAPCMSSAADSTSACTLPRKTARWLMLVSSLQLVGQVLQQVQRRALLPVAAGQQMVHFVDDQHARAHAAHGCRRRPAARGRSTQPRNERGARR